MCCCGKPSVNGRDNYSWDGKSFSIRKPWFPAMKEGDELVKDLPGRCGGCDSHSFDLRLVKSRGEYVLLVHSGLGDTRIELRAYGLRGKGVFEAMSEHDCYWMMMVVYHVQSDAASKARNVEGRNWYEAAAEKRIKTRKVRGSNAVKVWIEPRKAEATI